MKAPSLLVVGAVKLKAASPIFFKGKEKLVKTVLISGAVIPNIEEVIGLTPRLVHVIPSVEVAMLFPPPAIHKLFEYVTEYTTCCKIDPPLCVQVIPSVLVA